MQFNDLDKMFNKCPSCCRLLDPETLERAAGDFPISCPPQDVEGLLADWSQKGLVPPFLPELARLEMALHRAESNKPETQTASGPLPINPTLEMLQLGWSGLLELTSPAADGSSMPVATPQSLLVWHDPAGGRATAKIVDDRDLLALKIATDQDAIEDLARTGNIPRGDVERIIDEAVARGIILRPESQIFRDAVVFPDSCLVDRDIFFRVKNFSLQWHLTQACDLNCRHCYDRSSRNTLPLEQALLVLDDLRDFCRSRFVKGHVSFSGGNPLLYPHFMELYRAAAVRGLSVAILGNPADVKTIQELIAIQEPAFYQVSLEGLPEHNDYIRGKGHFKRVIGFLEILRTLKIKSQVMLTLTKDNLEQVLPLAERLEGLVDSFTFNRLAMVGAGAGLQSVEPERFRDFLAEYLQASKKSPTLRLKENLLNIFRHQQGRDYFRGCAGFGCGAAFSFITLLPDGEVHACRKFPSPVGNILKQSLAAIYDSETARRYRQGSSACRGCAIRPACGGCMAVVHGLGLDVFNDRDPYCFIEEHC